MAVMQEEEEKEEEEEESLLISEGVVLLRVKHLQQCSGRVTLYSFTLQYKNTHAHTHTQPK